MTIKRGLLRAGVCSAILVATGALTTISNSAIAACGSGGQCAVTGGYGSDVTFSGGTYESTFWLPQDTALYAANPGSIINASNVIVTSTSDPFGSYADKVWVENGGAINLTNSNVFGGLFGLRATGTDSQITMTGGNIDVSENAAFARGQSRLVFNGGVAITTTDHYSTGLDVRENSSALFESSTINTSGNFSFAAYGEGQAQLTFIDAKLDVDGVVATAVGGRDNTIWSLNRTNIASSGSYNMGVALFENAEFNFTNGTIEATGLNSVAVYGEENALLDIKNTTITATGIETTALALADNVVASFKDGSIKATGDRSWGVNLLEGARLTLENTTLSAEGAFASALYFDSYIATGIGSQVDILGGTVTSSANGVTVRGGRGNVLDVKDTTIEAEDRLIEVNTRFPFPDPTDLTFNAENSVLSGGVIIDSFASPDHLTMNLHDSHWTLHPALGSGSSSLSVLDFTNTAIRFATPVGGLYQSLTIGAGGTGTADVYNIGAGSHIEINTFINEGGAWLNQYSDQLWIHGNVSGRTLLQINEMTGSTGSPSSAFGTNASDEGISLVQVSGNAHPNSFYIEGDYMTLKGKPYVHRIYAFGPGSVYGSANSGQNQVGGGASHWDYRLQNEFIRNSHGWAVQVVPQVSNYLIAPTALFQAGLMDVGNLHTRLGEHRQTPRARESEQPTKLRGNFFLRAYGGGFDYHSNLSSIRYGYDADIRYKAVQAGGNLYGFETEAGEMMFGLAGSYGDLSFSPDRYDIRKTSMDIWSASAYASWTGTNGFYMDTILTYGGFSGNVSTKRYDHTAKLKGDSLTASIEIGQNFELGSEGWSIEPQAQLIYQRLDFNRAHDVDDFAIVLGNPDQWVGRIGGKLSKTMAVENVERLVIYGKLNLTHGFDDGDRVFLGDNFRLGDFGTQIEGGLGLHLDMSKNAALYGDVSYQGRIGDAGANGLSLNGGLRFQF